MECSYCGRENDKGAQQCTECGTRFFDKAPSGQLTNPASSVAGSLSPLFKWGLYLAPWSLVALQSALSEPRQLLQAPAFPVGLLGLIATGSRGKEGAIVLAWFAGLSVIIFGWGVYIALTVLMARTKKPNLFLLYYIPFCALLALNVSGCKKLAETAAGIH